MAERRAEIAIVGAGPIGLEMAANLVDRVQIKAGLVTSQLPVDHWHEIIANPTIADAILDRLMHNAHRLQLKGESMRKILGQLTEDEHLR